MNAAILIAVVAAAAFAGSAVGTGFLREYALRRSLLDGPNERSSHAAPTPRGGGLAIALSFLVALAVLVAAGAVPFRPAAAVGGAGAIVALIGFWDDHGHLAARWRLLAHFAAALWLLIAFGGMPDVFGLGDAPAVTVGGYVIGAFGIVWLINLCNFMDGIDGIASVGAITIALGGIIAALAAGAAAHVSMPVALIAAVAGFLVWNWPPARIFLGDVGSGFLGAVLAGLALEAGEVDPDLFYAWVILTGLFVVDATATLFRRALSGKRIYEAHRSHAYQRAARRFGAHAPVTLAAGAINLFWLTPLAVAAAVDALPGPVAFAIAYAPLVLLALWWKAGADEAPAIKD